MGGGLNKLIGQDVANGSFFVRGTRCQSDSRYLQHHAEYKHSLLTLNCVASVKPRTHNRPSLAGQWGRGAGKRVQIGAPTLNEALDAYVSRPKLRSEAHRSGVRQQFELHLKDWLKLPLDEITKSMVVDRHRSMAGVPSSAKHTLKYFRMVWNHARRVYDLPESPTMAIATLDMHSGSSECQMKLPKCRSQITSRPPGFRHRIVQRAVHVVDVFENLNRYGLVCGAV